VLAVLLVLLVLLMRVFLAFWLAFLFAQPFFDASDLFSASVAILILLES
jgi:hypothetical protein